VLDPRERFSAAADHYKKWRPSYPVEVVDWLIATAGLRASAKVVDLGCGTGISTRLLVSRGLDVTGVEPNEDMLAEAVRQGGKYVRGEAQKTGLPDRTFDLATAAQAFHWFPIAETLQELRRILKPGAWASAFWNVRAKTPLMEEYEALLKAASDEYASVPKPLPTIAAIKQAVGEVKESEIPNAQFLDREGLRGRAFSSSYVAHGVADKEAFARELDRVFDHHQRDGKVTFDYRTIVVAWRAS
jgi:ubiquinone/menaquinone biosynthesis C-methylase UbiE